jgi:hypothetical protein
MKLVKVMPLTAAVNFIGQVWPAMSWPPSVVTRAGNLAGHAGSWEEVSPYCNDPMSVPVFIVYQIFNIQASTFNSSRRQLLRLFAQNLFEDEFTRLIAVSPPRDGHGGPPRVCARLPIAGF